MADQICSFSTQIYVCWAASTRTNYLRRILRHCQYFDVSWGNAGGASRSSCFFLFSCWKMLHTGCLFVKRSHLLRTRIRRSGSYKCTSLTWWCHHGRTLSLSWKTVSGDLLRPPSSAKRIRRPLLLILALPMRHGRLQSRTFCLLKLVARNDSQERDLSRI